jgi:hypothetical protein
MFASKDIFLTASTGGYQISRSVRLRSSASAYLSRTPASNGSSTTWTWSNWVKRGALGTLQALFGSGNGSTVGTYIQFTTSDQIEIYYYSSAYIWRFITTPVYRDPSAWYHIVVDYDSSNATASDRMRLYVNGVRVTAFGTSSTISLNQNTSINSNSYAHNISASAAYIDGYLTEINFIDGQALTPSSFGETNAVTGVWQPKKYTGTYGTNGFYLNFSDNSNNTAATIGKDYSGNGNNWTPNNISVTAGTTYDSMIDVPTLYADGGNGRGNYAVPSPINQGSYVTLSNGNLTVTGNTATNSALTLASIGGLTSGKWYWEYTQGTVSSETCGVVTTYTPGTSLLNAENIGAFGVGARASGSVYGGTVGSITSWTNGDVIGLALDCDNGAIYWSKNGTWLNSGVPTSGSSKTGAVGVWTPSSSINVTPAFGAYNGGFVSATFGQRPFSYTPPTGFVALNTQNLPTPTISNGANYMAATLYTANASTQTITNTVNGVSFQPDLVWTKSRTGAYSHEWFDVLRGINAYIGSNNTAAEVVGTAQLTSFNSNGYTLGANENSNYTNGYAAVGWQWKANGTGVTNTSGSITSTVSAGATQGFSVVTYTGNSTSGATVGHGLGVAPKMIIVKARGTPNGIARSWFVYHASLGATKFIYLDQTSAVQTGSTVWNDTAPSSSVFTLGNENSVNMSANNYVAYCFAEVAGYSKFGSYTGNGSSDGPFVYLGFRPRWFLAKLTSSAGGSWHLIDTSRSPYNQVGLGLYPNLSSAESSDFASDILSNGLKIRNTQSELNASGATYIYAAFAENPTKFALAR